MMTTQYRIIWKRDREEIYFLGKTPKRWLDYLKEKNYRWDNQKKCWTIRLKARAS